MPIAKGRVLFWAGLLCAMGESEMYSEDSHDVEAILAHCVHCENTLTTFLGCLSCIRVTKECNQIGFSETSLRSSFFSYSS